METTYLIFVIILFILAISDLVVGVSNDAVNFLNSAVGAKVARHTVIMLVAAAGVFVGASCSNGMMEVARKGIFNPQYFTFADVMVIYMGVMLTDIILLDSFNRLGMPTSTTVSIVFEIMGGALAMAVVKIHNNPEAMSMADYINSASALKIIGAILISVVVAFTTGAIVQWIVRYLMTFNLDLNVKRFGSIYGGIAITAITYFILIKGLHGSVFAVPDANGNPTKYMVFLEWVGHNKSMFLLGCFVGWAVITQLCVWFFKMQIMKVVVLAGTFALALAFAGNDLVNFIGVPIAAFNSFQLFKATGDTSMLMSGLSGKVDSNVMFLIVAGAVMVLTLWFSKKARAVIKTGIDLARQGDGEERFGASNLARVIVRSSSNMSKSFGSVFPAKVKSSIARRFDATEYNKSIENMEEPPAFDLLRASVNLIVASLLISFASSLKLPLSTTYVTFMVAMGTSLADKAWGRESAVFRITGVFSVIGGWFLTAFIALAVSFLFANLINWGGLVAVLILFALAIFSLLRSQKSKTLEEDEVEEIDEDTLNELDLFKRKIRKNLEKVRALYLDTTIALTHEEHRKLHKLSDKSNDLYDNAKILKNETYKTAKNMDESMFEAALYHVQTLDYLRGAAHSLNYIASSCFKHVANNHKPLTEEQKQNLVNVSAMNNEFLIKAVDMIEKRNFDDIATVKALQLETLRLIKESTKVQVKTMKQNNMSSKATLLYLNFLQETKNMLVQVLNLVKFQRDADKAAVL